MNKREREKEVLVLEYNQVTVFMEKEKLDAIRRSLRGFCESKEIIEWTERIRLIEELDRRYIASIKSSDLSL